jgi:hypothetical protein
LNEKTQNRKIDAMRMRQNSEPRDVGHGVLFERQRLDETGTAR